MALSHLEKALACARQGDVKGMSLAIQQFGQADNERATIQHAHFEQTGTPIPDTERQARIDMMCQIIDAGLHLWKVLK